MSKLDWDECGHSVPRYRAEYLGYTITVIHDDMPANPFEDDEGSWPMSVYGGRDGFTDYDNTAPWSVRAPFGAFSDELLIHLQVHIASVLEITIEDLLRDYHHADVPMSYCRDAAILRDCFVSHYEAVVSDSRNLTVCSKLYDLAGVPNYRTQVRGYSQGDWAEVLVLAPPSLIENWCPDLTAEQLTDNLAAQAKLYGWWAWGDTWGWTVSLQSDPEDEIDSCWGYYGPDFDENGIEEAAMSTVEHLVHERRRARLSTLKRLIRNRVPLHLRPGLLPRIAA